MKSNKENIENQKIAKLILRANIKIKEYSEILKNIKPVIDNEEYKKLILELLDLNEKHEATGKKSSIEDYIIIYNVLETLKYSIGAMILNHVLYSKNHTLEFREKYYEFTEFVFYFIRCNHLIDTNDKDKFYVKFLVRVNKL